MNRLGLRSSSQGDFVEGGNSSLRNWSFIERPGKFLWLDFLTWGMCVKVENDKENLSIAKSLCNSLSN